MKNRPYTPAETAAVRRLYPEGGAAACRARMPGRSLRAIAQYAYQIDVRLTPAAFAASRLRGAYAPRQPKDAPKDAPKAAPEPKPAPKATPKAAPAYDFARPRAAADPRQRRCLRCRRDFDSKGIENRICRNCTVLNAKTTVVAVLRDGFNGYVPPHRGLG